MMRKVATTTGTGAKGFGRADYIKITIFGFALAALSVIDFFNRHSPNLGYSVMLGACFIYLLVGSAVLIKIKGRD